MESYGAVKQVNPRSASDHRATEILEQSTVHNEGPYQVGRLWSSDKVKHPNNFLSAMVQFKSLEKKLSKDPVLYKMDRQFKTISIKAMLLKWKVKTKSIAPEENGIYLV